MRNTLVLFLLVLFVSCGQQKTEKHPESKESAGQKTSVEFSDKMHNFGNLTAGEIVIHTFEFKNTGNYDYLIQRVVSDCSCILTRFTNEPVKPGGTGTIEVEFNTAGTAGREYKTIEIYGNSKELKHLAIFAEVKNEIIDIKY